MSAILEAFDKIAGFSWLNQAHISKIAAFLRSGSERDLVAIPGPTRFEDGYLVVTSFLHEGDVNDVMRRFWRVCAVSGWTKEFAESIAYWAKGQPKDTSRLKVALDEARRLKIPMDEFTVALALSNGEFMDEQAQLTPVGEFVTGASLAVLADAYTREHWRAQRLHECLRKAAPNCLDEVLREVLRQGLARKLPVGIWIELAGNPTTVELAVSAAIQIKGKLESFQLAAALSVLRPEQFRHTAVVNATERLLGKDTSSSCDCWWQAQEAGVWLVECALPEAQPALVKYFTMPISAQKGTHQAQCGYKRAVLDAAVKRLGHASLPLLAACFATDQGEVQLRALEHWIALKDPAQAEAIAGYLRKAFAGSDGVAVARAVRLAADFDLARVEAGLWPLFAHKSRGAREAAASTLARLGESRLSRATELWAAKKADARIATVSWLKALGTPAGLAALRDRLDDEENDDVRDAILLALEQAGGGADADPAELKRRMKATLAKLDGPPAKWLAVKKLPPAKLKSGKPLDTDALLYLLHRQSRVKDIRADLEARPLYALIDRETSGDLALAVLQSWQGAGADSEHRWALAFAALLGDDRLVPLLTRQIRDWAEAARGKLSEYAVQALALLGSDTALLAVDALAIRYRSKFKNIGKAATEAFAEAAAARGLTPEELGDRVVPWLGFEPGKPRIIPCGKTQVEVRLGSDFKFAFRDATTGKKVAKLPDSAPAEVKGEFKELAASLKEAVKAQLLRMEALMVRQFRWTTARWRELYLAQPLLIPFAQRLVWGCFDDTGKLTATCRALDDLTLTDAADESFTLPATGQMGVVHPLELAPEPRVAWVRHLADYNIEPPFAQLDRPVVAVKPEQAALKFSKELDGTSLNAMTFKGRAERLGWARGSVCDAGGINYYRKTFPNAGVEVFLGLEGMYVGVDMYSDVTLGEVFFVKSGSVKIGGYEYDEPSHENDPRLVTFGAVPPIAFSEALGDLARIAGKETAAKAGEQD